MKRSLLLLAVALLGISAAAEDRRVKLINQAETAVFPARMKVIDHKFFYGEKGVMLADDAASTMQNPDRNDPDLTFTFDVKEPGRYWVVSRAATFGDARKLMAKAASKYESFCIRLAIDDDFVRERVLISPWENQDNTQRELLRVSLTAGTHTIRVWLPKGCALDSLSLYPYNPPAIPEAARNYQPKVVPGNAHPRIWATPETLPQIRANLTHPTHRKAWDQIRKDANTPFEYKAVTGAEAQYNGQLHVMAEARAFVYLMTGDKAKGREAVNLMTAYLGAIEFGNMLDITRELGSAIYTGALVYDWCYDLLSEEDERILRTNLLRLAEDMEIGWPPFRQPIVNGHGNEMQVNRDLLAMSIALYGKEFEAYRLCSWLIMEQLAPLRAFEYVSNRHNQGVSYGTYRFGAEMRGAWMMRRMSGKEVFDPNIKTLGWYFLYYIRPDGAILPEGDGSLSNSPWSGGDTSFLIYSYAANPVFKAEFLRQKATAADNVLFLTLDDPTLPAITEEERKNLPLTHYYQPPLPGMIARTGWDIGPYSNDAMVSMQGGDTHFGNHQHMDAGNFQIYYRGMIVADLGIYGFYGTPYDMGFNKRSIAHSVMLLHDPADKSHRYNDGGMRMNQTYPITVADTRKASMRQGKVLGAFIGPDKNRPVFSYLKNDLTQAYYGKAGAYFRSYCFVNLGMEKHPGALLVVDRVTPRDDSVREYWSVNTLAKPEPTAQGIEVRSVRDVLPGKVTLSMFLPEKWKREIVGGPDGSLTNVFGQELRPPAASSPLATGYRTTFAPAKQGKSDVYAAAMVIADDNAPELPVRFRNSDGRAIFQLPGYTVCLTTAAERSSKPFRLEVKEKSLVLADGVTDGAWQVSGNGRTRTFAAADGGTLVMDLEPGVYQIAPAAAGSQAEAMPVIAAAERPLPKPGIYVGSQRKEEATIRQGEVLYVPVTAVAEDFNMECRTAAQGLQIKVQGRDWEFRADEPEIRVNGKAVRMPNRPIVRNGVWYLPDYLLGAMGNRRFARELGSGNVLFSGQTIDNGGLLWLDSNCAMTPDDWAMITRNELSKGANYWAAVGKGVTFTAHFVDAKMLDAVGIAWLNGGVRKAFFKLEVYDGANWKTVYDGTSRQTSALEYYEFPKQQVWGIRFTGNGNTVNGWNSIIQFKMRDAE